MSHQQSTLPVSPDLAIIDSLEFARRGGRIEGEVAVSALARLAGVVVGSNGRLRCSISGELDKDGKPTLLLNVDGELDLLCQRCLQVFRWPLRSATRLLLVAPGDAWPDEDLADDEADAIAADKMQSVLALIEDEVLLALPIAPTHAACESPVASDSNAKQSPFALLANLKKS